MFTQHSMNMMIEEAWTMPSLKQLRRRSWAASSSGFMHEISTAERENARLHQNIVREREAEPSFLCHPSHSTAPKQLPDVSVDSEPAFLVTPIMARVARSAHAASSSSSTGLTNQSNLNEVSPVYTANNNNNNNYHNSNIGDLAQQLQSVLDGPLATISSHGRISRMRRHEQQHQQHQRRRLSLSCIPLSPLRNDIHDDNWMNDESMGSFFPYVSPTSAAIRSPAVHARSNMNYLVVKKNSYDNMNSINSMSISDLPFMHSPPQKASNIHHNIHNNKINAKVSPSSYLQNTISTAVLTPQGSEDSIRSRESDAPSFFADLCNAVPPTPLTTSTSPDLCRVDDKVVEEGDEDEINTCPSDDSIRIASAASTVTLSSWPSVSSVSSASHRSQMMLPASSPSLRDSHSTVLAMATSGCVNTASSAGQRHQEIPSDIEIVTLRTYESPKPKYFKIRQMSAEMPMLGLLPALPTLSSMSIPRKRIQAATTTKTSRQYSMIPPRTRLRRRRQPDVSSFAPSEVEQRRRVQRDYKCQVQELHQLLNAWDEQNRALLEGQQCAMSAIRRMSQKN